MDSVSLSQLATKGFNAFFMILDKDIIYFVFET